MSAQPAFTQDELRTIYEALTIARAEYFSKIDEMRKSPFAKRRRRADEFARQIFEVDAILSKLDAP